MAKNEELKKENTQLIRTCFYQGGSWTKNSLSEKTGLSLAGTTNILQDLQERNEILYVGDSDSTGGRKSKQYTLNPEYSHIGTIFCRREVNDYCFLVQIVNLDSDVLQSFVINSDQGTISDFQKALRWLKKDPQIQYIAVSIPGVCSQGQIRSCDFANLEKMNMGAVIAKECHVPYVIENDVNTACISYAKKEGNMHDIALVYQPKVAYIGCGIMIRGRLYNGEHHEAGEMKNFKKHENSPKEELEKVISSLQAVLDPQKIVWGSDVVKELDPSFTDLVHINTIDAYVQNGLYEMAKYELLQLRKEED